jgi:hypothetical protein
LNTLITAATSAKAYALKKQLNPEDIILGDYLELPAFMLTSSKMIRLPNPESATYTHQMLTLCLNKQITTIYALRKEEQEILKTAEQLLNEYGIKIIHSI